MPHALSDPTLGAAPHAPAHASQRMRAKAAVAEGVRGGNFGATAATVLMLQLSYHSGGRPHTSTTQLVWCAVNY